MSIIKRMTYNEAKALGRLKTFEFSKCEPTYKGSGIYVIEFDNGIKFGMSKHIQSRLSNYEAPWVREPIQYQCYKSKSAPSLENLIKTTFQKNITFANSREFISGVSFNDVLLFLENNEFFKK